jgi:hypothetical protein
VSPGLQLGVDGVRPVPLLLHLPAVLLLLLLSAVLPLLLQVLWLLLLVRIRQLLLLVLLDPDLLLPLLLVLLDQAVLLQLDNKVKNYFSRRSYKFQDPSQVHLRQPLKTLPL